MQGGASVIGDGVSAGISHISGSGWDTCGRLGRKGSIQREVGRHRHIINRPVISGSSLLQVYHDDGGSGPYTGSLLLTPGPFLCYELHEAVASRLMT